MPRRNEPYPITPVGDGTLHCTIEMVADTTADKITPEERDDLVAALRTHLAFTGPLEVTAGLRSPTGSGRSWTFAR
ncbi:hypothetical protein [Kitasatospora sp. Ki12]